jgi:hypothetical protein
MIFVGTFALDIPKVQERVKCTCRDLVQFLFGQFVGDFGGLRFFGWLPDLGHSGTPLFGLIARDHGFVSA